MAQEPLQNLRKALRDSSRWVRLGAAQVTPWLAPGNARALLEDQAAILIDQPRPDEAAVVAVALARAGGDPVPLIADMLQAEPAAVRTALLQKQDDWVRFVNERLGSIGRRGHGRLLQPFWASWHAARQHGTAVDRPTNQDEAALRAAYALSTFRQWHRMMTLGENESVASTQIHARAAIAALEDGDAAEGAQQLVRLALTSPDWRDRSAARHALPMLGTIASTRLMSIVAGQGGPMPDDATLQGIAEESDEQLADLVTADSLQLFLASDALKDFGDPETTFALINAATTWRSAARGTAARIVADMSADSALPALLWSALNLPSGVEREAAAELLSRIVDDHDAVGIRANRVGPMELRSRQLDWLKEIRESGLDARDWIADTSVTLPVLGAAISIIPDAVGDLGRQYSEPSTAARATYFERLRPSIASWLGSGPPREVQARPPRIGFPAYCRTGDAEQLSVELLLPEAKGGLSPIDIEFPRGKTEVELLVTVLAPGFDVPIDCQPMLLRRDAPAGPVTFALTPRELGEQAIDIKFKAGTAIVGQCCVITQVTEDQRGGEASAAVLDPVAAEVLQIESAAQAVLRVKSAGDVLEWSITTQREGPRDVGRSPKSIARAEIDAWARRQDPIIKEMLRTERSSENDQKAIQDQLSGFGNELYKQIAPETLAAELAGLQENALVVIDTDADWIPWELLATRPTEPLWGQRFVIVRAPTVNKTPNATIATPATQSPALERALIVAGDKVRYQSELPEKTFGGMSSRGTPPLIESDWAGLKLAIQGKDIVHFNCHGRSQPRYHLSYQEGDLGRLYPNQVHQLGLKWGAVVFANACGSATVDLLLADFVNFGREFYYAGARPFIGTLAPVPEDDAIEFARLFYEQFALAGLPAGHALRRAKEESARRLKRPTWMFYCLYGNPSVVRRWSGG